MAAQRLVGHVSLGTNNAGWAIFRDGPAETSTWISSRGRRYASMHTGRCQLGRLPWFLRVVVEHRRCEPRDLAPGVPMPETVAVWDALDQLDDTPRPEEEIHVYMQHRWSHSRGIGFVAEYLHVPDVDGETVRDNEAWRARVAELAAEHAARA